MIMARVICASLLTLLSVSSTCAQRRANPAQDRAAIDNGWYFDYQAAQAVARRTNKPLMIVFRCVP